MPQAPCGACHMLRLLGRPRRGDCYPPVLCILCYVVPGLLAGGGGGGVPTQDRLLGGIVPQGAGGVLCIVKLRRKWPFRKVVGHGSLGPRSPIF